MEQKRVIIISNVISCLAHFYAAMLSNSSFYAIIQSWQSCNGKLPKATKNVNKILKKSAKHFVLLKVTLTSHLLCPATWYFYSGRGRRSPCLQAMEDMLRQIPFGSGYSDPELSRLRLWREKSALEAWCRRPVCWQNRYSIGYHLKPSLMGRVISKIQGLSKVKRKLDGAKGFHWWFAKEFHRNQCWRLGNRTWLRNWLHRSIAKAAPNSWKY